MNFEWEYKCEYSGGLKEVVEGNALHNNKEWEEELYIYTYRIELFLVPVKMWNYMYYVECWWSQRLGGTISLYRLESE